MARPRGFTHPDVTAMFVDWMRDYQSRTGVTNYEAAKLVGISAPHYNDIMLLQAGVGAKALRGLAALKKRDDA